MNTDWLFAVRFGLLLILAVMTGQEFARAVPTAIRERNGSMVVAAWYFSLTLVMAASAVISPLGILWPDGRPVWLPPALVFQDVSLALAVGTLAWLRFSRQRSVKLSESARLLGLPDREVARQLKEERRRNEALQRLVADMEHFVYAAAHDLRAPLRSISGFVDLILETRDQPPDPEFLGFIEAGTRKLLALIDSLADYSRVEAAETTFAPVNLEEMARSVLLDLSQQIEAKGVTVEVEPLPLANGAPAKVYQVIQNLIDNAVKFGAKRVEVSGIARGEQVEIAVRDDGIGIGPEYLEKIFGIFQRLNREEDYEGTGMGLAICRKVVTQHGGRIWVESEPGRGSTFRFTLPRGEG